MNCSLKITQEDLDHLTKAVFKDLPNENGAFLLAGSRTHSEGVEVLIRRVIEIPKEDFKVQQKTRLEISSRAINGLIALCEANNLGAVLCHSHPEPWSYSQSDNFGEERILNTLRSFLPTAPTASLLAFPSGYSGRYWTEKGPFPLSHLTVLGRSITNIPLGTKDDLDPVVPELYDRQVLAFGKVGQEKISRAKIAIVGVGATGSCTAEQLVRLGVRNLIIIDPDYFEPSNSTRVYGSFASSDRPSWFNPLGGRKPQKTKIVAKHLRKIRRGVSIKESSSNIVCEDAAKLLLDRDVIFSCTDDHWGRSIITQIAYQYMIPTINIGVRIDSEDGRIIAGTGVVHILRPRKPCLWCNDYIRADRIRAESMLPDQRSSLLREGYVSEIDTKEPSVISLTTTVSGVAVTMFLQLMTDFMGSNGDVFTFRLDPLTGRVTRGDCQIRIDCICKAVEGYGDFRSLNTIKDKVLLKEMRKVRI